MTNTLFLVRCQIKIILPLHDARQGFFFGPFLIVLSVDLFFQHHMLPSTSNGNDVANPFFHQFLRNFLDQTHFFIFSKHNQICKTSAKAFVPFHHQELVCQQRREKCFRKVPSDQSKVFFFSKLTHNQTFFRLSQCVLFLKKKCSFFFKLSKSEHCSFHSF